MRFQHFILGLLGLNAILAGVSAQEECSCVEIFEEKDNDYKARVTVYTQVVFHGFHAELTFSSPCKGITFSPGQSTQVDETHFKLDSEQHKVEDGALVFEFELHFEGEKPLLIEITMNDEDVCAGTTDWTTIPPMPDYCESTGMAPYDYSQALCMSYLFYEAQRSGVLPADQRVNWRFDSAVDDGQDVGLDLSGGYYDAGDHVKFGFPLAFTTTMLGWGLIDFAEGHEAAGQTDYGKAAVKWATDYLLKAHSGHYELYGQVGKGDDDHNYWGRPEEMTMPRPSMKIDNDHPGSELAAETAAALAAASLVFSEDDPEYAAEMLESARELYQFADERRENYHISIPDAAAFYRSWSGYGDELTWAALWLARATGEDEYMTKAKAHWDEFDMGEIGEQFSWDDKKLGAYALFTLLDESPEYQEHLQAFLDHIMNDKPYTPGGLVFLDMWGANRHAANIAFVSLWAAKHGIEPEINRPWAEGQINFLLGGGAGHSWVNGFGVDPPARPHHRSSSCPMWPSECLDNEAKSNPNPNPHTLFGALVGGPSQDGAYKDDRMDYVHNEVACDYNAAFTGALAAMAENH